MELKQYQRIKELAENGQFTDLNYANQLISTLCEELIDLSLDNHHLRNKIKHRPEVYPHHCFLVTSKYNTNEFYLFREKYEAEMFRSSHKSQIDLLVKTVELFETHKKALLRKDYDFLKLAKV